LTDPSQLHNQIEDGRKGVAILYGYIQDLRAENHRLKKTVDELSRWATAWSDRETERMERRRRGPYSRKGKGSIATMVAHGRRVDSDLSE